MSQGFAFFGICSGLDAGCVPHSRQFSFPHPHICTSFKADGEHCVVSSTQRCAPRDQPYLLSSLLPAEAKLISSLL